jgi:predicted nuclease of predicted toxin-antitoxin system
MRTLVSELGARLDEEPGAPRIYADANVPARMVGFMRQRLKWDVLFVMEHPDLRRARDVEHYRRARDMRRTLVSLDHDFFDDVAFPPAESGGVVVIEAVDERAFVQILRRIDREWFSRSVALPIAGRKVLLHS